MDNAPNDIDLELLRVLDALHRERHVTHAAVRVGISQPAMSRALSRLRDVFGDELFVRTVHGMVPTPRADALVPQARRILEDAKSMFAQSDFDPKKLERTFVIGASDFLDADLLPELLEKTRGSRGVALVMRPIDVNATDSLMSGALDLIVGVKSALPPEAVAQHLYNEPFVSAVRKGHPRVKKSLTLKMYLELDHLLIAPRNDGGGLVDVALAKLGHTRRVVARTYAFQSAPLVASRSDLILTAPATMLAPVAKALGLVLFPPPIAIPPFQVMLAWHPRMKKDPAHAWFRKLVAGAARRRVQ